MSCVGFESGSQFVSYADSNGHGQTGSATNPSGQKSLLKRQIPDGGEPSGTSGRKVWDSNPW